MSHRAARGARVSRQSVHNFFMELAEVLKEEHRADPPDPGGKTQMVDVEEVKGVRPGAKDEHQVLVALVRNPELRGCEVVNVEVGSKPRDVLKDPMERLTTDNDGSRAMLPARRHQSCHRHIYSDVEVEMWKVVWRKKGDWKKRAASLDRTRRQGLLKELAGIPGRLRASVKTHLSDGKMARLRWRIRRTLQELGNMARRLGRLGYLRAANYLRKHARGAVIFAEAALEGEYMPARSSAA